MDAARQDRGDALSVSGAMALAKGALEGLVVRLIGEVSEVSNKAGYKAVYFTVKDQSASLPCMMWNNRYHSSGVELRVGALVELSGRFTLYAAKGRMNFDVFTLELAGEGRLRMQVTQLARKLHAEGLMDPSRKRALPVLPETIGLVTSPRGAAVHDVLRTLRRRYPMARVLLAGVPVEGQQAPRYLCEGLKRVVSEGAELVLLVRGGGSFEDLMPFNDEALAREIASCPVPVVTGIGHEPDTSIADLVADLRTSTPTAAAEASSPDCVSLEQSFVGMERSMLHSAEFAIESRKSKLELLANRELFANPEGLFSQEALSLDFLSDRLVRAIPQSMERDKSAVELYRVKLAACALQFGRSERNAFNLLQTRFIGCGKRFTERFEPAIGVNASRLNDLSPLAVLSRGYSIARDGEGRIVKETAGVAPGSALSVSVSDGELECSVLNVRIRNSKE